MWFLMGGNVRGTMTEKTQKETSNSSGCGEHVQVEPERMRYRWDSAGSERPTTNVSEPSSSAGGGQCDVAAFTSTPTPASASCPPTPFSYLWNHLKKLNYSDGLRENFLVKGCTCNECEFCRTKISACAVFARTFLLKVFIRPLYKFLERSKGRRRSRKVGFPYLSGGRPYRMSPPSPIATILLVCSALIGIAEACSSRNTPKPRPPPPSARPNITFPTYTCPPTYAAWYCLNGATCFTIKIEESLLYNCECAEGFMGQRCEFKDLDGSYLPSRQRVLLETASIAGGATIAVFLVVIACVTLYLHYQRKSKEKRIAGTDRKDGPERDLERRAFNRCLSISMDRLPEFHTDRISKSTAVMMGTRETDYSPP